MRIARSKLMANGILKQLNQSLEVTLRDSLDGLEDFTLQMAYAGAGMPFEILSIDSSVAESPSLKLVDTPDAVTTAQPLIQNQRRG